MVSLINGSQKSSSSYFLLCLRTKLVFSTGCLIIGNNHETTFSSSLVYWLHFFDVRITCKKMFASLPTTTTNNSSNDSFITDDNGTSWNATHDWNAEEYLYNNWGSKQLSMHVLAPITVVYVLLFVSGVVGNVSTCIVIIRIPSMHTATNCYLFSLAVSDLTFLIFGKWRTYDPTCYFKSLLIIDYILNAMTSIGLPNDLGLYWRQYPYILGEVFCRFRALITEM